MSDDKENDNKIKHVKDAKSLNELIDSINKLSSTWDDIYGPVDEAKSATLKAAGLDKTPGSNIKHVINGLILAIIVEQDMKQVSDLKNAFSVGEQPPFVEIKSNEKFLDCITNLPKWIKAYFKALTQLDDLVDKLEKIPGDATNVAKNAPDEFEHLEFMAKAKMVKNVVSTVGTVKDKVEEIMD